LVERILIDGRSGSGKSELASGLHAALPGYQLLRLDDLYPGWGGLDAASRALPEILRTGRWRRWDWVADAPGAWQELDLQRPLIVEGAGALSRASRPLADLAIWVGLDGRTRKRRALEREGEVYAEHWDRWAAQERAFIARERPRRLADLVVSGRSAAEVLGVVLDRVSRS
jgi:uridine kinase